MPPYPLANLWVERYKNKFQFNGVYSRNSLQNAASAAKTGEYVINLKKCKSVGTQWITSYMNGNNLTYFDGSIVQFIPK